MWKLKTVVAAAFLVVPEVAAAHQILIYSDEVRYLHVRPLLIDNGMSLTGHHGETIFEKAFHNGPIDVTPINLVLRPGETNKLKLMIFNEPDPYPPPAPSIGNPYRVDLSFDIIKPNAPPVNRAVITEKSANLWPGRGAWGPFEIEITIIPASR